MNTGERSATLYEITDELAQLIDERESAETDEQRAACDETIALYMEGLADKVDNIIAYVCDRESAARAAKEEAERLAKVARQRQAAADRVRAFALTVMQAQGYRKLEGRLGRIRVQANGGQLPLVIDVPQSLPDSVCSATIQTDWITWLKMLSVCRRAFANDTWLPQVAMREPNTTIIRALLKDGAVEGARLSERGVHLRIE